MNIELQNALTKDITKFVQSNKRNTWLKYFEVAIYIRKSIRVKYNTYSALDLGQIIVDPGSQGQGIGTMVLDTLEKVAKEHDYRAVYVESVMSERYASGLVKRGYLLYDNIHPASYIKLLP